MTSRRDKTWKECWEVVQDIIHYPDVDSSIRYLDVLHLTDRDWTRVVALMIGFAITVLGMVCTVFWITWRALLWSLGYL